MKIKIYEYENIYYKIIINVRRDVHVYDLDWS